MEMSNTVGCVVKPMKTYMTMVMVVTVMQHPASLNSMHSLSCGQ